MQVKYSPFRFLAALGNGGIVITFFLYLNFMVPHKNTPVIDFASIFNVMKNGSWLVNILIILALLGVIVFALRHFYYLIDNIKVYYAQNYSASQKKELGLERMVIPLTLGMTMNVVFILGSIFVPGLWNITEYLFPISTLAFIVLGLSASWMFINCFSEKIQVGEKNKPMNNLSRLIPVFTFSMLAVGLAAPAAMSHTHVTAVISALLSIFLFSISLFIGFIQLSAGFGTIVREGISKEGSTTLWIMIPILTILNITIIRMSHFLAHNLGFEPTSAFYFVIISMFFSLQILLGLIGYFVMKNNGYFADYVKGDILSFGSYSLICPGVAFVVLGMFLVHIGLIKTGLMPKFSVTHIVLVILLALLQIKTIYTILVLDKRLLKS